MITLTGESSVLDIEIISGFDKLTIICYVCPFRLVMGAGVLWASRGARVWRLEARLLLPDASLLHERGGAEPGESFSISTRAHTDVHTLTCTRPRVLSQGVREFADQLQFYLLAGRNKSCACFLFSKLESVTQIWWAAYFVYTQPICKQTLLPYWLQQSTSM